MFSTDNNKRIKKILSETGHKSGLDHFSGKQHKKQVQFKSVLLCSQFIVTTINAIWFHVLRTCVYFLFLLFYFCRRKKKKKRLTLTFSTSSKSFSEMSGNSILWEGSMMACSLAIWLVMLWNGVFPYVMQYRIHPRDQTSPLGLIFGERGEKNVYIVVLQSEITA